MKNLVMNSHPVAILLGTSHVQELIAKDWNAHEGFAMVNGLRGTEQTAVRNKGQHIVMGQDVVLREPVRDEHIGGLSGQIRVLELPQHTLLQLGKGVDQRLAFFQRQCFALQIGAHREVDNSMLGTLNELQNVLGQRLALSIDVHAAHLDHIG